MSKKKQIKIEVSKDPRPYVLWRRVSTTEQGADGLGIAAQLTIAQTFMGKDPIEIYTDVYTGTDLKRCENLWKAIKVCKDNDYVLVVAKSDRFRSVQDALDVLDAVGQPMVGPPNIVFCDLPTADRFILTVMWAMWERQAIMGRINTKLAMAERKRQIKEQGGFMSKNGNWITHFGHKKGYHNPHFSEAGAKARADAANDWRATSTLFLSVKGWYLSGMSRQKMIELANKLYEEHPDQFCSRQGKPLTDALLCKYIKIIDHEAH